MSRSASAAPRSPATVVKRANISVFLPTSLKILARVYWVMSFVTVKVPNAPEPLACMRRSGITSRTKLASFSFSHTSCASSGPRGPAVRLLRLVGTGAPKSVVRWVTGHFLVSSFIGGSFGGGWTQKSLRPQAPHAAILGEPHAKFTSIVFMG